MALQLHQQRDSAGVQPCPVDGQAMKPIDYQGVAMCACRQCLGLWLEAGQFSRLLELVEPPRQADLSNIGQCVPGSSSSSSIDGLGDILEFASDVFDVLGNFTD
ncbi:TFIIB-type zinc ribbon-containing protein [Pseudoduganella aquatica]|uniref:TFIIB-type zinc ribbon-containing protein n=1 Tax=Pseudoduganella aquatica TaxID=2660641 RepID=UPI0016525408|nr:zf-TFIIB domain-containing protein [Pseudoduganella aquatica]